MIDKIPIEIIIINCIVLLNPDTEIICLAINTTKNRPVAASNYPSNTTLQPHLLGFFYGLNAA